MPSLTGFPPDFVRALPVRAFIAIEINAESGNQSPQEIHMKPPTGFWSGGGASFFY
jgi:hypothetical protein